MTTLIKLPRVKTITSLSRSAIYARIAAGSFPKQIKLSEKSSAWVEEEIYEWVQEQIAKSRPEQATATGKTA